MSKNIKLENNRYLAKLLLLWSSAIILFNISGCKKMVEIPPAQTGFPADAVYTNDVTATSVLTGLYSTMTYGFFQGSAGISICAATSADELSVFSGADVRSLAYYRNALAAVGSNVFGSDHWSPLYNMIYVTNAAIDGLTSSKANSLTPSVKQQLLGEAKFLRAFCFFYLTNLYGDIPLTITTDYKVNTLLARNKKDDVYKQIIADLLDAKDLLNQNYLDESLQSQTTERVRPTKWAAIALLARAYLYAGDPAKSEAEASSVIGNNSLYSLLPLNDVFLKNSKEAIWQIQNVYSNFNTVEGYFLNIPSSGLDGGRPYSISDQLWNSFETGDLRAEPKNWIDTITVSGTQIKFPFKYKVGIPNSNINSNTGTQYMTEYYMVLRLGEQYLIRAEARAQLGNINGAQSDLNTIRHRAGLGDTPANDKTSLLDAILNERRHELFTEWGHRWFDLKRTGKVDEVMTVVTPLKAYGQLWKSYQQLYPLPQADLNRAPNLKQNPGY